MSNYPNSIDSFTRLVNYNDIFEEDIALSSSPVAFIIEVSHDILSSVTFSDIYTTEVTVSPSAGQFRPIYGTNQIELGPLSENTTITVSYKCIGDVIKGEHINTLQESVENIEETLGSNPQGSFSNVAERLNNLEVSSSLIADSQDFTGTCDGLKTEFSLSNTPKSKDYIRVFINGLRVRPSQYTVTGNKVILSEAPKDTDELFIEYWR
jgi:hypothetical protein